MFSILKYSRCQDRPTLADANLCYQNMVDPTQEIAFTMNDTFSDSPNYLHLIADINLHLKDKTINKFKYEYHLIKVSRECKSTLIITRAPRDFNVYHIKLNLMTEYQGDILTTFEIFIHFQSKICLVKIIDHYRLFQLFLDSRINEEYTVYSQIMKKVDSIDKTEIINKLALLNDHMKYVCVVANKKLAVLKLVRDFNGPPMGHFGSLTVVIYKDSNYIHLERWHAWKCSTKNLIYYLTSTLITDEAVESKDIYFIINDFGGPYIDISSPIAYEDMLKHHPFVSPSLQIKKLSDISNPLTTGLPIYIVKSKWEERSCYGGYNMYVRKTIPGNDPIQASMMGLWTIEWKILIIYDPKNELCRQT